MADTGLETIADMDPRPARLRLPLALPAGRLPQLTRALLAATAAGCVALALLLLLTASSSVIGLLQAAAYGLLAALAAAALRLRPHWLGHGLAAVWVLVTLTLGLGAWQQGLSLAAPGLQWLGLAVCLLSVAAGWPAGAVLAAMAAVLTAALAMQPAAAGATAAASALQWGLHLLALVAGLAGGRVISRLLSTYMLSAQMREQRFKSLLGLSTDAYWELDAHYNLVSLVQNDPEPHAVIPEGGLAVVPWAMPQFACSGETLDALMADLDSRRPFRDLLIGWTLGDGSQRHYLASGEPRFDERGVFTGYWGVTRDVTEMHAARAALVATETRYEDLFARIPTPLVLHRGGRVVEANPAAVKMFGQASLKEMVGIDLLKAYQSGDSRERERRRLDSLHEQPLGTALPVAEFKLQVPGRLASVRATTVQVDSADGPAMLAIYLDDTDRLAAEQAVRRSESLLAHLVATSPDLITLTEMASARLAMVNTAFERTLGWNAQTAVGRTAEELGLWDDTASGLQFLHLMHEQGKVTDLPVRFRTQQGKSVSMLLSAARFVMDRRDYMVINARDVTETERARLEREAILNNASIGIAVTRARSFVLANPHFEHIHGWERGELIGKPEQMVWASPEAYGELDLIGDTPLARGESLEIDVQARRKDGSTFLARVRARAIDPTRPAEGGTAWIVEDVTERRQFEQALARARDEAEAANRAKSAFLANTSHELRTPLNGMIGLARMASASDVDEDRRRQYLDQITDSAQALAGVISDILDLSKIEAGKLQLENARFDLGELLRKLHRTYITLAASHGLRLHFEMDTSVQGTVNGDALRVRQILSNFLNNALKFTERGQIQLRAHRHDGQATGTVRIEVHDTGPGIDEATRERLFEPFTQADQSTTRRFGGTGLGLSICRELSVLMGGSVGVHSVLGQGSTFWVELPLPAVAPETAPVRLAPVGPQPGDATLAGARVLMVEDNPVNMLIASAMLERWGVRVTQAQDGREAVAAVQAAAAAGQPFDAVLMDVQMPVMSGHEATRTLRGLPQGQSLPIIALTAAALVTERDQALAAGMNDFLTKPIDADKLRSTLLRWCGVTHEG